MPAAVTPAGVRDGEPGALAGLCAARGPSVLAYCRHVAGDADAGAAAADAFARFRAAVVATDELSGLDPEALLLDATRSAAASRAASSLPETCAAVPALLGARASRTIASGELELLEQHLQACWTCRAAVARFKAAERAYRDPPDPAMDPAIIAQIIAAMADAVPAPQARPPAAPSANGHAAPAAPVPPPPDSAAPAAPVPPPPDSAAPAAPVPPPPDSAAPAAPVPTDATGTTADATTRWRGAVIGAAGALRRRGARADDAPAGEEPQDAAGAQRRRRTARITGGARLPRAQRPAAPTAAPRRPGSRARSRRGNRLRLVLPVGVVLAALLVALFVSGVVGGGDPASSPRIDVPADVPADVSGDTEPADVVVVPGAEEASAAEVERAKARDRERVKRRREAAAAERQAPATAPPAAATAPPATAPPPPPAAAAPARERDGGGSSGRRIEPGNGATGAEQIPPAEDTSTVPDLAPAPETATAP